MCVECTTCICFILIVGFPRPYKYLQQSLWNMDREITRIVCKLYISESPIFCEFYMIIIFYLLYRSMMTLTYCLFIFNCILPC